MKIKPRKRNKSWRLQRRFGWQWESRHHPDFLFIAVRHSQVLRRNGNCMFDLVQPEVIYEGKDQQDAIRWARKWVRIHSDKL